MNRRQLQKAIERHGKISSSSYARAARMARGASAMRPVRKMVTKIGNAKVDDVVGSAPEGFGHSFLWERDAEQIALIIFLSVHGDRG